MIAQSLKKNYADGRVRPLVFMVGDKVWLTILPLKVVMWFEKKDKLNARYIGPLRF